jgi:hypothetical protein
MWDNNATIAMSRLGWEWHKVTNALAYYDSEIFRPIKSFRDEIFCCYDTKVKDPNYVFQMKSQSLKLI